MSHPIAYRRDVRCLDCASNRMRKDDHIRNKQAYFVYRWLPHSRRHVGWQRRGSELE